jgi:predicted NAD-dependent protein-ADP-ribosyltransferase YbiA (DUF1768 family)
LNRWYIFVRRSDRRPAPPSLVAASRPSVALEGSNSASAAASAFVESKTGYPGDSEAVGLDVIDLPDAAEDKQYRVDPSTVTPDLRLGAELSDWPRYMSTGTLIEIADSVNPAIKYPSVEAAIASAKYQRATTAKPDLGPKLFSVEGSVHQKYDAERVKAAGDEAAIRRATDDQLAMTRTVSGRNSVKKYKAEWNQSQWDAARDEVYRTYLSERYRVDARFRTMVQAIKEKGGEILFVNGVDPSQLGVGVRVDGSLAGGDNLVGKWIMDLAKTA